MKNEHEYAREYPLDINLFGGFHGRAPMLKLSKRQEWVLPWPRREDNFRGASFSSSILTHGVGLGRWLYQVEPKPKTEVFQAESEEAMFSLL